MLRLTRDQILAYRRRVSHLDARLPAGPESLQRAAHAGLADSMPRAAVLSIGARVEGATPSSWEDPVYVQVWGLRYSVYVVTKEDVPVFTLGRMPESGAIRERAQDVAKRLHAHMDGSPPIPFSEVGKAIGYKDANVLRYAALTGSVLIRWEGARRPTVWTVPTPEMGEQDARRELVRRYLHVFGPSTPESFGSWAGVRRPTFLDLELVPVDTPVGGEAWILAEDEELLREESLPPAPARFLPSGDTFYLLWGADRELMIPDKARRNELWTSRVWPGAVLVGGEIVGTWRRTKGKVKVFPWRKLSKRVMETIEAEAASMPLDDEVTVRWEE